VSIKIKHINDQIVSQWSGGTTTQLYLQPEDSVFSDRNFDLRISTAKIEQELSEWLYKEIKSS
jgi:environmental stress-induced protein Ves